MPLDGVTYYREDGFWMKFEVRKVEPGHKVPHGIRYSLTLHDSNNERILGFDNAHGIKPKKGKLGARKITWDHKHKNDQVEFYEFQSASQLLEDFFKAVDEITANL